MRRSSKGTTRRAPAYDQQAALEAQARHRVMDDNTERRITQFRHGYEFLATMALTPFVAPNRDGTWVDYLSAEHYYQSRKAHSRRDEKWVLSARTPGEARERGSRVEFPEDWPDKRLGVMRTALLYKFPAHNSLLGRKLIGTDPAELIETGYFGDKYWGMAWDSTTGKWIGLNILGALLMARRAELRSRCDYPFLAHVHTAEAAAMHQSGMVVGQMVTVALDTHRWSYLAQRAAGDRQSVSEYVACLLYRVVDDKISADAHTETAMPTISRKDSAGAPATQGPERLTKTKFAARPGRGLRRMQAPQTQPAPALHRHCGHPGIRWRTS